jgi:hypothetical protein
MLMLLLTWTGAVLGLTILLLLALGPVIVEVDARLYERRSLSRRQSKKYQNHHDHQDDAQQRESPQPRPPSIVSAHR